MTALAIEPLVDRTAADEQTNDQVMPAYVARAAADLAGKPAETVLRWAFLAFGDRVVVSSSMTDAVLVDLASRVRPGVDVIFLDTGLHFAETVGMRDAVASTYPITLRNVTPALTVAEQDAAYGPRLFERDPDRCCALRKVAPLETALAPYDVWVTGLRRADSRSRVGAREVEWDARRGKIKVNPIVGWSDAQVTAYAARRGLLENPLVAEGYPSIGCAPCTRPVAAGQDARAGRWVGTGKVECGLHR